MFTKLDISEFDKMYSIMEKSFPVDEHRPYDEQKSLFQNEYYNAYGEKDGEILKGFIAVWDFPEFLFIEHFAVMPDCRNQGIGEKLLNNLKSLYNKPVCLEVEPPENDMTRRRIGFYERNGFLLNEYPYIQPPISKGKNPVPLMIMSSEEKLTKKTFTKIKQTLYNKVYGCDEKDY